MKSFVGQQKSNLGFQDTASSGISENIGTHIDSIHQADPMNGMPALNNLKSAEPEESNSPFSKLKKRFDRFC